MYNDLGGIASEKCTSTCEGVQMGSASAAGLGTDGPICRVLFPFKLSTFGDSHIRILTPWVQMNLLPHSELSCIPTKVALHSLNRRSQEGLAAG